MPIKEPANKEQRKEHYHNPTSLPYHYTYHTEEQEKKNKNNIQQGIFRVMLRANPMVNASLFVSILIYQQTVGRHTLVHLIIILIYEQNQ